MYTLYNSINKGLYYSKAVYAGSKLIVLVCSVILKQLGQCASVHSWLQYISEGLFSFL